MWYYVYRKKLREGFATSRLELGHISKVNDNETVGFIAIIVLSSSFGVANSS